MKKKFPQKVKLEIITPCFNEEENINIFIKKFKNKLSQLNLDDYIITVVDDGSDLQTKHYYDIYEEDNQVRVIELSKNYGHQTAIFAGLENSLGEYILVMDIDLQDPIDTAINLFEECLNNNSDFVRGVRTKREGESFAKIFTANFFYKILSFLSDNNELSSKSSGDFYCMSKRFKEALLSNLSSRLYLRGEITKIGFNQKEIEYVRKDRKIGSTKFSFLKMLRFAYSGILSSSTKPLRISGLIGLLGLIFSISLTIGLIFYRLFYGTETPGWTFIVTSIYLCTSIILICLSIISEYISLLIESSRMRKRYFIRKIR
tara:strand:+ start:27454 stop:28404 length:951 start_codon:yes stop_codon:yes gene_type:complete